MVVGDPSYAFGVFRQSSVGWLVVIGVGAGGMRGGWIGKEGKRFPV